MISLLLGVSGQPKRLSLVCERARAASCWALGLVLGGHRGALIGGGGRGAFAVGGWGGGLSWGWFPDSDVGVLLCVQVHGISCFRVCTIFQSQLHVSGARFVILWTHIHIHN